MLGIVIAFSLTEADDIGGRLAKMPSALHPEKGAAEVLMKGFAQ